MKSKVNYLGVVAIVLLSILISKISDNTLSKYWLIVAFIPLVIFLYQMIFRYRRLTKKLLLSPFNIFACRASKTISTELDSDLLFEKVVLEINNVGLKTRYADKTEMSILVSIPMNLKTWGENVYIDILNNGKVSDLLIQSTSPQVISWGRNDENIERLVQNIEDSFTI